MRIIQQGYWLSKAEAISRSKKYNLGQECKIMSEFELKKIPYFSEHLNLKMMRDIAISKCPLEVSWDKSARSGSPYIFTTIMGGNKYLWFKTIYWKTVGLINFEDRRYKSIPLTLMIPIIAPSGFTDGVVGLGDSNLF